MCDVAYFTRGTVKPIQNERHPERGEGSALMRETNLTRGDSSHSLRMAQLVWESERPREPSSLRIRHAFPRRTVGTSRKHQRLDTTPHPQIAQILADSIIPIHFIAYI